MGEKENKPFQLSVNGLLKVDFQAAPIDLPPENESES